MLILRFLYDVSFSIKKEGKRAGEKKSEGRRGKDRVRGGELRGRRGEIRWSFGSYGEKKFLKLISTFFSSYL